MSMLQNGGCNFISAGGRTRYCKSLLSSAPNTVLHGVFLDKETEADKLSFSLKEDYPECMREQLGDRLPPFSASEWAMLHEADTHFYGMNYYTSQFARHRQTPAPAEDFVGNVDEFQEDKHGRPVGTKSGLGWLRSCPDLFRKHLTRVYRLYGKHIYITENGCPCPGEDKMTREQSVNDTYRIEYFDSHLEAIAKSVSEDGSDIRGYFAWSLMDNLGTCQNVVRTWGPISLTLVFIAEWSDGYGPRFGVTFTDYDTLERTPKRSATLLGNMIAMKQGLAPNGDSGHVKPVRLEKARVLIKV